MNDVLDPLKNPVTYAVPFFLLTILIELAALRWLDHDSAFDNRGVTGYAAKDAGTSMLMGLGSLVSTLVFKVGAFVVYSAVFVYVHRVNVGWAAHQAHHSSEYMNFATALRQKWNPWFEFFFFLPLPFLGIAPWAIYMAFGFNLIYQFYVHTELVGKMWRPIELVMNTPSHHRVHHGSDPEYLDKNYAGIFIVWDRMFGTFQPEIQRPTYGLTKPVETYNLIKLQYGDYAQIVRNVRAAERFRDKLGYLFGPPGWEPAGHRPDPDLVPIRPPAPAGR
jgi:sterol desaturase/sphingolipid hydroxylase (fatty acid hydroxylase superfamily)